MNQSALDKRVRELAVLMLMKRCNCEYGFVRHIDIAKACGSVRSRLMISATINRAHDSLPMIR